ncbi:hypothetical protein AMECASPLE_022533 [Ameca splendens]|uniref:Uncharacterized protein n=1 Tax=Ameca splendens TaxID=208324 RepID=A0ABV0ZD62_9TELE
MSCIQSKTYFELNAAFNIFLKFTEERVDNHSEKMIFFQGSIQVWNQVLELRTEYELVPLLLHLCAGMKSGNNLQCSILNNALFEKARQLCGYTQQCQLHKSTDLR